jgi:hypothetical protein
MRLLAAVMALGLAAMLAAPPAAANPFEAMTVEEREAFRAELRAYLLENPEVLEEGDRPVSPLWRSSRVTCYAAWAA